MTTLTTPTWLRRWAVLTVCATAPLLVLGATVTTKQVGMVDPVGFREPWHMLRVPLQELGLGFVIEHSHRVAGFVVGLCVIVLAAGLWLGEPRRWLRWLGMAALLGVCLQGLLGGFRVNLNALMGRDLALLHGSFAQLVFALLVSLALFTSRGWASLSVADEPVAVRRWTLLTAALLYLQLVLGALVRHKDLAYGARVHLLTAFAVVAAVVWLVKLVLEHHPGDTVRLRPVLLLGGLVAAQLVLGVESWLSKFVSPEWHQARPLPVHPEELRTLHYFVGSLLFATSVVAALQAHRAGFATRPTTAPLGRLEGAA